MSQLNELLEKLDQAFQNTHPSWIFLKRNAIQIIQFFCEEKREIYQIEITNWEMETYLEDPCTTCTMLGEILIDIGINQESISLQGLVLTISIKL